jgi:hypothetical protein
VGHEQEAELHVVLQLREQVDDRRLHRDVEGRGHFVAHEQRGLGRERAGDRDALPLAAAQLVRVTGHDRGPELDPLQCRDDPGVPLLRPELEEEAQRLIDDLADRLARVERAVRTLEDVLDPLACPSVARARIVRQRAPVEVDRAGEVTVETGDAARERRLTGARLADERDALARPDGKADAEQHLAVAVGGIDVLHVDERLAFVASRPRGRGPPLACAEREHLRMPEATHDVALRDG